MNYRRKNQSLGQIKLQRRHIEKPLKLWWYWNRYWTEKPWFLQDTLVGAVKIACNQRPQHKTHVTVCKSMRRIRKKCIVAEAQVRQLEHEKAILSFGNGEDKDKDTVTIFQTGCENPRADHRKGPTAVPLTKIARKINFD